MAVKEVLREEQVLVTSVPSSIQPKTYVNYFVIVNNSSMNTVVIHCVFHQPWVKIALLSFFKWTFFFLVKTLFICLLMY